MYLKPIKATTRVKTAAKAVPISVTEPLRSGAMKAAEADVTKPTEPRDTRAIIFFIVKPFCEFRIYPYPRNREGLA